MRYEGVKSVPPPNHHDLGAPGTSTVEDYNLMSIRMTVPNNEEHLSELNYM